jgi:hypothetical protein
MILLSGLNARGEISVDVSSTVRTGVQFCPSQRMIRSYKPPDASSCPLGENAKEIIGLA